MNDTRRPIWFFAVAIAFAVAAFDALPAPATGKSKQTPEALYHNYCSVCHGDRGDGRSRATNSLVPPPKSFTTQEAIRDLSRERMILAVREGRPGTAMTGWKTQLDDKQIEAVVDYIRVTFMQPVVSPAVQRGRAIYQGSCAVCHGDQGQGAVWAAGNMRIPPRDFRTPKAANELTRERMIAAVTHGRPGTAMSGFGSQLKKDEIEAVVDFVRAAFMMPASHGISGVHAHGSGAPAAADMALRFPKGLVGDARKGRVFYEANCATCHGAAGDGKGPRAYFINPKPRDFTSEAARATLNRPALFEATANGRLGAEMPAWNKVITDQQIANVAEYVFDAFIRPAPAKAARKK